MKFIYLYRFGVRGNFWNSLIPEPSKLSGGSVITPDLDFSTVDSSIKCYKNEMIQTQENGLVTH